MVNGAWEVDFEIRAKNRPEGWAVVPRLAFVGLDGGHMDINWTRFDVEEGAETDGDGTVVLRPRPRGRILSATVHGVSIRELPIPASESAIDVRLAAADIASAAGVPKVSL